MTLTTTAAKTFYLSFLAAVMLLTSSFLQAASTEWKTNEQGQVRLIAPYRVAPSEGPVELGIHFKTKPGWHVYWKNPGDAGYPPRLNWEGTQGLSDPELLFPTPHRFALPGDLIAIGYEGEVVYPIRATSSPSNGRITIQAQVDYLTCNESCIPYKYSFTLDLPVAKRPEIDPEIEPLLAGYRVRLPRPASQWGNLQWSSSLYRSGETVYFLGRAHPASESISPVPDIFFEPSTRFDTDPPDFRKDASGDFVVRAAIRVRSGQHLENAPIAYVVTGFQDGGLPFGIEKRETLGKISTTDPEFEKLPAWINSHPMASGTPGKSLFLILLLGFIGGLILNIMPCVLPVMSLKLFGLIKHGGASHALILRNALASAAGILTSFMGLALAAILAKNAGAAVGWGVQFQEPLFVAFLMIVVTFFALNLWGVLEIPLPAFLGRAAGQHSEGMAGQFVSGLFATLLATPCSAPFLGTALGFALAQSAGIIILVFLAVGLGMASPYILLAFTPRVLHWLPKPGQWMIVMKQALGFLLAATAVWLHFVLAGQISSLGLSYVLLGLTGIGFGAWLTQSLAVARKKTWVGWILLLFMSVFTLHAATSYRAIPNAASESTVPAGAIAWQPFDEAALEGWLKQGKPVFVDVTADWCFTCKVNEKAVLESGEISAAFARYGVIPMKADWTTHNTGIANYLASFSRYGIPFNALYVPGQKPHVFSELLTKAQMRDALRALEKSH